MRSGLKKFIWVGFFGCLVWSDIAAAEESHPNIGLEAQYSEAVIAFDRQQTDDALKILNEILENHPDYTQAVELKALALRSEGKDQLAINEYLKLIKAKDEKDRGPYYFEIGVLCYRNKNYEIARLYLERAITLEINVAPSHLFLGMMDFSDGQYLNAETHFQEVMKTGLPEMKVVAHYYVGIIYLKNGSPSRGSREMATARTLAKELPDSKMAQDTEGGIDKVLAPFSKGSFFGTATVQAVYDSNISETPTGSATQAQASNAGTVQSVFSGGIGYMSPALADWQYVASYQLSYNYNFNSAVEQYEYFSNFASVYINRSPLADTSYGAKISGNFIFQNLPNDPTNLSGSYTETKYLISGELGPYFYTQLAPHYRFGAEFYVRPQDFYTEPDLSGTDYLMRLTVQRETPDVFLNPGASLTLENNSASGDDWKYRGYTISLFDTVRPNANDTLSLGLDIVRYDYYASFSGRSDTTLNPHLNALHKLSDKWALTGQVSYTTNASTEADDYSYNRFVIGFGVSRSL